MSNGLQQSERLLIRLMVPEGACDASSSWTWPPPSAGCSNLLASRLGIAAEGHPITPEWYR